ncbi:MAG: NUDIX hydrolase [Cypionkella sp.]|nr:NUDIX hydrolase [Cypionkella sp.]
MSQNIHTDTGKPVAGQPVASKPVPNPQFAALCWRLRRGRVEVLLITSRETGRWVIPKGWPMNGRAPHETAEIEAWQEAGVKGEISPEMLGVFHYDKLYPAKPATHCQVSVFALRTARLEPKFPEKTERRRKWFSPKKASKSVAEAELAKLILAAAKQLKKL